MEVVSLNVGGETFTTSLQTLCKDGGSRLCQLFSTDLENFAKDSEGRFFIDRDGKHFAKILNFLRDGVCAYPPPRTSEWSELRKEVEYFRLFPMLSEMMELEEAMPAPSVSSSAAAVAAAAAASQEPPAPPADELSDVAKRSLELEEREAKILATLSSPTIVKHATEREKEALRVELQRVRYERDQTELVNKNTGRRLAYNLLIVGITGAGKSSTLNTLLDRQACKISGGQAQGTRGCTLQDGTIDDEHFVSFIDTQGLGADTSVTDAELLSQIMLATESILKLGVINHILITFDLGSRATPANMANQLTLMELFAELRQSSFVVFTKWNTNAVQAEWNIPLRKWIHKWKRASSVEAIKADPPSYEVMYECFCLYIVKSMSHEQDGGAFSKMGTFLAFFESRVLWMFNLDALQVEDKDSGELLPYQIRLYQYYRDQALRTLDRGSTVINTNDLSFLKSDSDTMAKVATELVLQRDRKIFQLEQVGADRAGLGQMQAAFKANSKEATQKIKAKDFRVSPNSMDRIGRIADVVKTIAVVGCVVM